MSCSANPSRATWPHVIHMAGGKSASCAVASASSEAELPPAMSALIRPTVGRSNVTSARFPPYVAVSLPSCGTGVSGLARCAASCVCLARSESGSGAFDGSGCLSLC